MQVGDKVWIYNDNAHAGDIIVSGTLVRKEQVFWLVRWDNVDSTTSWEFPEYIYSDKRICLEKSCQRLLLLIKDNNIRINDLQNSVLTEQQQRNFREQMLNYISGMLLRS